MTNMRGITWHDTTYGDGFIRKHDGTTWQQDAIPVFSSAPSGFTGNSYEDGNLYFNSTDRKLYSYDYANNNWVEVGGAGEQTLGIALSDETTSITTGTAKVTIRAPYAMTLTSIPRATLSTASTSGNPTVDINVNGSSVLGASKLSIDANEKTSTTANTPTSISSSSIADDDEITFDIDTAGTGAKGLKVYLYYEKV